MKSSLSSIAVILLLPLLFVHWVGDAVSAAYIFLLFIFASLYRLIRGRLPKKVIDLLALLVLYLAVVAKINKVAGSDLIDFSSSGHLKLTYQATSFFMVVILTALLPKLSKKQSNRLFYTYYVTILTTIIGEWILVNMLGVSNSLMPAYRSAHGYYEAYNGFYRPFGLTGVAPVNGSMLVIATWIMILFVRPSRAKYYLTLTLAALVLNNSGQALLAFFTTCAMYFAGRYKRVVRSFIFAIGTGMLIGVIYSGIFSKMSIDYILNVNQYWHFEIFDQMDITHIIFGGYSYYKDLFSGFSTEFYPIYAVSRFGLLLTLSTWIYIWLKLPLRGKWILFAALFLGSIHYATILYIPTLMLLAVLITSKPARFPAIPEERALR